MVRNNYARYFHEDFFENPGSSNTTLPDNNIDIPVIAKAKESLKLTSAVNKDFNEFIEDGLPRHSAPGNNSPEQNSNLLFNKAPNFFETSYHSQKVFWAAVIIIALLPVCKSGFITLISLSQNISKNMTLKKIETKLNKDTHSIKSKLTSYHSQSGMKRTIKEEIKVIEENEILIKIVK